MIKEETLAEIEGERGGVSGLKEENIIVRTSKLFDEMGCLEQRPARATPEAIGTNAAMGIGSKIQNAHADLQISSYISSYT